MFITASDRKLVLWSGLGENYNSQIPIKRVGSGRLHFSEHMGGGRCVKAHGNSTKYCSTVKASTSNILGDSVKSFPLFNGKKILVLITDTPK